MTKSILKITLIIFLNLFAFLSIWIILGALFWNKEQFLILCIIVSIIPLLIFLYIETQSTLKKLNNISKENNNDSNWK